MNKKLIHTLLLAGLVTFANLAIAHGANEPDHDTSAIGKAGELAKVGRTIDVIIDEVDAEGAVGRSKWDAPEIDGRVFVRGATDRVPGDLMRAKVHRSDAYDLWAEPASASA